MIMPLVFMYLAGMVGAVATLFTVVIISDIDEYGWDADYFTPLCLWVASAIFLALSIWSLP